MSEEHLTDEQVERFLQRKSLSEFEQIDRHLADCELCRARLCATLPLLDTYRGIKTEISVATEPDHLTYPQAVAYIEGHLDEVDREIVDLHLELCNRCTEVIVGLREIEQFIQASCVEPPAAVSIPTVSST